MANIEFFNKPNGDCPVAEFLSKLNKDDRPKVALKLQYLEDFGHTAKRPYVGNLGDGLYELRITGCLHGSYRIFYFFWEREIIVLTHAILKKTDKIPPAEIDRAKKYRQQFIASRKG